MITSLIGRFDFSYWPVGSLIFGVAGILFMAFWAPLRRAPKPLHDLILYFLGVIAVLGLVGIGLSFAPNYYRSLGGVEFLSTQKEPVFDAQAFFGVVGILTGVPIALAGSIYAILLARRAERTETQKFESDLEERLEKISLTITGNFSRMTEALLDINAAAAQLFEQASELCSNVIDGDQSSLTLGQCKSIITESGTLASLKDKINALRDCMTDIQRDGPSMNALGEMLNKQKEGLAAFHFLNAEISDAKGIQSKLYQQDRRNLSWTWLSYAMGEADAAPQDEGEKLNVVEPLEMLRLQVGRLCCEDVLMAVFEMALMGALAKGLSGEDVSTFALKSDKLFESSWWAQSTRQKEETYWLRTLGRMLLVRPISEMRPLHTKKRRDWTVNFGAVILEDLCRMIPAKDYVKKAISNQSVYKRLFELNQGAIPEYIKSISYASKESVPTYFEDGVNDSFKLNPKTGVVDKKYLLFLRLPKYTSEIDKLIRDGIKRPDEFREKWSIFYREYLIAGLIEDMNNLYSGQTLVDTKTLRVNAPLVDGLKQAHLTKAADSNLVSRYLLHLADISMESGDAVKAKAYYCRAYEGGRPATVQQLSLWVEGIVGKLPFEICIQGELLAPDEVADADGLLPIIGFQFLDGMLYRSDPKALVDYAAEFPDGHVFPDFIELWPKLREFLETLPRVESGSKPVDDSKSSNTRSLDDTYQKWYEYVTRNSSKLLKAKLAA